MSLITVLRNIYIQIEINAKSEIEINWPAIEASHDTGNQAILKYSQKQTTECTNVYDTNALTD